MHGLQVGIVTELAGDPGKEHRIRVKVPLAGMDEQGVWARVATLDAGDQRGTVFRPEKDDEVVLGFFHDDPAQPVVLGMLHSSAKAPPIEPTDDNDEKGYVSRSKIALAVRRQEEGRDPGDARRQPPDPERRRRRHHAGGPERQLDRAEQGRHRADERARRP